MSADIMGALPAHPRTALRQAVGAVIEAAGFSGRVYLNPEEPWDAPSFPSVGVYVMSEQAAESDLSPRPDSREATLAVDILEAVRGNRLPLDDRIEALELAVDRALTFEAVDREFTARGGQLEDFEYSGMELGKADNGEITVACLTLTFTAFYRMPPREGTVDLFRTGYIEWDLADGMNHPDGRREATDIVTLPQDGDESKGE